MDRSLDFLLICSNVPFIGKSERGFDENNWNQYSMHTSSVHCCKMSINDSYKQWCKICHLTVFLKSQNVPLRRCQHQSFARHFTWTGCFVWSCVTSVSSPHENTSLSGPFRQVIIILYQCEPSVSALIWKVCNCYLPPLSTPLPNSIVGMHTHSHTHTHPHTESKRETHTHTHKQTEQA